MTATDHYILNAYEPEKQNENMFVYETDTIISSSDDEQAHLKKSQEKIAGLKGDSSVNDKKFEGTARTKVMDPGSSLPSTLKRKVKKEEASPDVEMPTMNSFSSSLGKNHLMHKYSPFVQNSNNLMSSENEIMDEGNFKCSFG